MIQDNCIMFRIKTMYYNFQQIESKAVYSRGIYAALRQHRMQDGTKHIIMIDIS